MHLLLTRPIEEARTSASKLVAIGHKVTVSPVLEVVLDPSVPIERDGVCALVVTSARAIAALNQRTDRARLKDLPVYTVGDASAEAARDAGFASVHSASGDVEALGAFVCARIDPAEGALLYACGRDRHGALEEQLAGAGYSIRVAEVYRAEAANALSVEARDALARGEIDGVVVYSARSARIFLDLVAHAGLRSALRRLTLFAISPAAATALRAAAQAGTAEEAGSEMRIVVADRPDEASLLDCVAMAR
ncbi:uroporphyrinogen-III synthase [Breoghania sp. L-A4]|uniref:uroporphyrinogen-III synthase n=1 Tax=Breoghania sp. L-A4 TaxID=2304600 RepID=UPI000E35A4DC|nr:uroporphyrinogen-III synthase [Breoghania sp. L-A4]AXS42241.1 uroporphyrinogen-III synthase [Breoghania sp. L-A4]